MSIYQQSFMPDLRPPKSPKRFFASLTARMAPPEDIPPMPPLPTLPRLPSAPYKHDKYDKYDTYDKYSSPKSPHPAYGYKSPKTYPSRSHTPTSSYSSTNSTGLGYGAEVVRTPSDARRGIKTPTPPTPIDLDSSPRWKENEYFLPRTPSTAPVLPELRTQFGRLNVDSYYPAISPVELRPKPSLQNLCPPKDRDRDREREYRRETYRPHWYDIDNRSLKEPSLDRKKERRSTVRPPPKNTALPSTPFAGTIISKITKASPTAQSGVLVHLQFGYNTEEPHFNNGVTIPFEILRRAGGNLFKLVQGCLDDGYDRRISDSSHEPEMTDGSSADESDLDSENDLGALLRDEYFKSLLITSPTIPSFIDLPASRKPTKPLTPSLKHQPKRPHTRNQYTQQDHYPSPSSPYTSNTPISIRRKGIKMTLAPTNIPTESDGGGIVIEIKVLLLRDAGLYHCIVARLVEGGWGGLEGKRKKLEEECRWLGMVGLAEELLERGLERKKSMVLRGGEGYI